MLSPYFCSQFLPKIPFFLREANTFKRFSVVWLISTSRFHRFESAHPRRSLRSQRHWCCTWRRLSWMLGTSGRKPMGRATGIPKGQLRISLTSVINVEYCFDLEKNQRVVSDIFLKFMYGAYRFAGCVGKLCRENHWFITHPWHGIRDGDLAASNVLQFMMATRIW